MASPAVTLILKACVYIYLSTVVSWFLPFSFFAFSFWSLGDTEHSSLITYPNTLQIWSWLQHITLSANTYTHMLNICTVPKGFSWLVIKHLLHVTICTCAYLAIGKSKINCAVPNPKHAVIDSVINYCNKWDGYTYSVVKGCWRLN